jgi:glycosyltransferase involved in cell wall biosynthesis
VHCPSLKELPSPPAGKTGWPWTEDTPPLSQAIGGESHWPRISIVTPSLNQGRFIEETIRSVLLQGYPDLEYIIIDGGSADGTVDVIKRYEKWLAYWVTEPDQGQSQAINKGFAEASGAIQAYLNSDDLYAPHAFQTVAPLFAGNETCHLAAGECISISPDTGKTIARPGWPDNLTHFLKPFSSTFAQPAAFWSKVIFDRIGGFDENLHFCFDREFFLRIGMQGRTPRLVQKPLACYREHPTTKTNTQQAKFFEETIRMVQKLGPLLELSRTELKKREQEIDKDWEYINIFMQWKKRGRRVALLNFLNMLCHFPTLIFERRIIGLARRLLFVKYKNVKEFQSSKRPFVII